MFASDVGDRLVRMMEQAIIGALGVGLDGEKKELTSKAFRTKRDATRGAVLLEGGGFRPQSLAEKNASTAVALDTLRALRKSCVAASATGALLLHPNQFDADLKGCDVKPLALWAPSKVSAAEAVEALEIHLKVKAACRRSCVQWHGECNCSLKFAKRGLLRRVGLASSVGGRSRLCLFFKSKKDDIYPSDFNTRLKLTTSSGREIGGSPDVLVKKAIRAAVDAGWHESHGSGNSAPEWVVQLVRDVPSA
jgi:hypothetical protein